ncbi:MAG TPA: hypothetical protein VL098_15295 [Flavipsychrobacter sp.]|nr:hypothetical protein [Flavipsychrobacter sp.]
MVEIELLQQRLHLLIKKYQALKYENIRLKKAIAAQTEDLASLNKQFEVIEQNMMLEHMGKKMLNEEEKKAMKKQITNVIGEIDKLLLSLND